MVVDFNALTFCMFPEKRSTVEEMAFFTFLKRSFFVSELPTSFFARRWTKHLQAGRKNYFQGGVFISVEHRFIPVFLSVTWQKFQDFKTANFLKKCLRSEFNCAAKAWQINRANYQLEH